MPKKHSIQWKKTPWSVTWNAVSMIQTQRIHVWASHHRALQPAVGRRANLSDSQESGGSGYEWHGRKGPSILNPAQTFLWLQYSVAYKRGLLSLHLPLR